MNRNNLFNERRSWRRTISIGIAATLTLLFVSCATTQHHSSTRIALVSDTHTTFSTKAASFSNHLRKVVADINAAGVDIVLISGDLTDTGRPEQFKAFKEQVRDFKPLLFFVAGNHDVGTKSGVKNSFPINMEKVIRFEENLGASFFATNCAGLRIVGVNGSLFGRGLPRETEQWGFLERELANPKKIPTVLFSHYPPFIKTFDEPGGIYWNMEPKPRARLLALLKRGGVKTMLSGHLHRPLVNRHDGILFVSGLPVSFGIPQGKQPPGWTLVTIAPSGEAQVQFKEIEFN
jgi:3',5'-cyclic-AMP phosphodiesterase